MDTSTHIYKILTSKGKLLVAIAMNGGKIEFSKARKIVGSQIYPAVRRGIVEGWLHDDGTYLSIVDEKMKRLAECLSKCFNSFDTNE